MTSDANGRVTQDETGGAYTWDVRGRLVGLTKGGKTYAFQYGPDGLRLNKTVGGVLTTYLLDGGQVVTDTTNGTAAQTLYGPGTDHPLARNGEYFLPNSLGSTSLLTDSSGNSKQVYQYSPFGALLNAPTDSNPFQFTGRENDGDGLLYYRARYYNPGWGRFVSADPAGLGGGVNPYVYARNDPVNHGDPSGQMDEGNLPGATPINIPDYTGPTPNPDPTGFNEVLTEGGPPGGGGSGGNSTPGFGAHGINDVAGSSGGDTTAPGPGASSGGGGGGSGPTSQLPASNVPPGTIPPGWNGPPDPGSPGPPAPPSNPPGWPLPGPPDYVVSPGGVAVAIPPGSTGRVANNGQGSVYTLPGGGDIRIMDPRWDYTGGYVRFYNPGGQPVIPVPGPSGALIPGTKTGTRDLTHVGM